MTSSSPPLKFLFAVHNHQPVGNFGHVFEAVFEKAYRPYLEILSRFKKLKTTAHFTGPLLEWIEAQRPEFLRTLQDLTAAGRLELLGGGFYEPLLATLPEKDAIGQVLMMSDYLEDRFGARPRGLWLAERVWSPFLPKLLAAAEMEFTLLDDTHFLFTGLQKESLNGYFITEHQGHPLRVFPILKPLRYAIPFQLPETTLQFLQDRRRTGGPAAVTYGDDGEKFGGWPDTWDWVYGQGYLEKWFATLEANADWLETTHFAGYMDTHPPSGRVYLPPASYEEMMEWALPVDTAREFKNLKERLAGPEEMADEAGRFLHGGVWDSFLTKYVEANQLHKKMLHVSRKVGQMEPGAAAAAEARAELYRGQCNCAYWHGMFGGLYLNYLRHAVYHHLIRAESLAEANLRPAGGLTVEWLDFDLDGQVEVVVTHPQMSAEVAPARGGALVELDFRPAAFNLLNVLTRREEIYHDRIRQGEVPGAETGEPRSIHDRVRLQDPALADALIYDRLDRLAFMDHLLPADISLEQLQSGSFADRADLAGHPYLAAPSPPLPPDNPFRLHLTRATGAGPGGPPITLTKSYTFDPVRARVQVDYHLASQGNQPLVGVWGVEFNFTLLAGDAADRYYCLETQEDRRLISAGEIQQTSRFAARDEWSGFEIRWTLAPAARVVRFPIETVSQSEDGFEKTYQGSCLWFLWDLELEPGGEREWTVELAVEKIQPAGA